MKSHVNDGCHLSVVPTNTSSKSLQSAHWWNSDHSANVKMATESSCHHGTKIRMNIYMKPAL